MILSLQYLRAIAVILVLLIHISDKSGQYGSGLLNFRDGRFGVDIFFVLSGFVMYYVSLNKQAGLNTIWKFVKHRIFRIIPLYWLLTTVALGIFLIMPENVNRSGGETMILESYFLYPVNSPKEKFLLSLGWTLSYEFYFYMIFAVSLFFKNKKALVLGVILLTLASIGMIYDFKREDVLLKFLTNTLLLEFLYGILIVKVYQKINFKKSSFSILFFTLFVASYTFYYFGYKTNYRGIDLGLPAMFLVLSFVMLEDRIKQSTNKIILAIGESSYSTYLVHLFVLAISGIIYKKIGIHNTFTEVIFILTMFIGSLITGYITYHLLEKRMTRYLYSK